MSIKEVVKRIVHDAISENYIYIYKESLEEYGITLEELRKEVNVIDTGGYWLIILPKNVRLNEEVVKFIRRLVSHCVSKEWLKGYASVIAEYVIEDVLGENTEGDPLAKYILMLSRDYGLVEDVDKREVKIGRTKVWKCGTRYVVFHSDSTDMRHRDVWEEIKHKVYGLKVPPDLVAQRFSDEGVEIAEGVRVFPSFTIIDGAFSIIDYDVIRGDQETIAELKGIVRDLEKLERMVSEDRKNHVRVAKKIVREMIEGLEDKTIDKYELCGRLGKEDYVDQILCDVVDYNNPEITKLSREIRERLTRTVIKLICKSYIRRRKRYVSTPC